MGIMEFCEPCFVLFFELRIVRHVSISCATFVLRVSVKEKSPACLFNGAQGAKEGDVDPMKRGLFVPYSGSWICMLKTFNCG